MNLQVIVKKKEGYGNELYYPVNDVAKVFTELTKSKTLTRRQLQLIGKIAAIHVTF